MIDKELNDFLDTLRTNSVQKWRVVEKIKSGMSQLMLMLANSGAFPAESSLAESIRQLHQSWLEELSDADAMTSSMTAIFNGKGAVARELENRIAEINYLKSQHPASRQIDESNRAYILKEALARFNYKPEILPPQSHPLRLFCTQVNETMTGAIPMHFTADTGEVPVESLLTHSNIPQFLQGDYKSGIYAAFSNGPDYPFGWILVLRVESKLHHGLTCLLVQHYSTNMPVIFLHHPYENYWLQWDQTTNFPGLTGELEEELNKVIDEAGLLTYDTMDRQGRFEEEVESLRLKAKELFFLSSNMPERDGIVVPSRHQPRALGEFAQQFNTARVGAICNDAVLVFYGTMIGENDNWVVTSNVIRPAKPGVDFIDLIDPKSLDGHKRVALVQAANYVIDHWTACATESKNTK